MDPDTFTRWVVGPFIVFFWCFSVWFSLIYKAERPPSQDDHLPILGES